MFYGIDISECLYGRDIFQCVPHVRVVTNCPAIEVSESSRWKIYPTSYVAHWWSIGPSRRCCRFDSPVRQGIFSQSQLSVQTLLRVSVRPRCAIACINICVHVKDPVFHVRVLWIMETLKKKKPACTVGWVARLCPSWLSPGKATRISHGSY